MTSAVLASRNESSWAQSGKALYSHPIMNPNSNPKNKKKQFHHHTSNGTGRRNCIDDSPVITQSASDDDAYSFNQRAIESSSNHEGFNIGGYLTYDIASYSKSELHELRNRLVVELDGIRNLRDRIDSGQFSTNNTRTQGKTKKLSGKKRPIPFGSSKDPKNGNVSGHNGGVKGIELDSLMKDCRQILTKLMKHKNGWVFNVPVDAEALGLHDYHNIVKRPMDLGTVKSKFAKNLYSTPDEFAADVRLTFNNALLYNPKTDPVHEFAEQLLGRFEDLYRPIQCKVDNFENGSREFHVGDELQGTSWNHNLVPDRAKKPKASSLTRVSKEQERISKEQERMQNYSSSSTPSLPAPHSNPPVRQQSPEATASPPPSPVKVPPPKPEVQVRVPMGKQPKPRAKDPSKREMSMEEKHKLGVGLQSLPQEKMPQLIQIVRKRNDHLAEDGDEIELDIEALDTETLWELDRFVTNWKKLASKTKRLGLMINLGPSSATAGASASTTSITDPDGATASEKNDSFKKLKNGEVRDEDVDIDDDMPATAFPLVEIEKDEAGGGRVHGNGSSSSSSSSSGSDSSSSDSESGSDSDADDAQS